jgi:hypothetical protein
VREQESLTTRLLIGTEGRPEDETALAALCEVLDPDRAQLRIVRVITVPITPPLEVQIPEAEEHAARLLTRAREITRLNSSSCPVITVHLPHK